MAKTIKTILRYVIIGFFALLGVCFLYFLYYSLTYRNELRAIKKSINQINGVEVLNIWGHEDIELEEISARINIKDKGEIVLFGLSKDYYDYPRHVYVSEIGGLSFSTFTCTGSLGVGSTIDIGTNSRLGRSMISPFNSVQDVINNYDTIYSIINKIRLNPELGHFSEIKFEEFIFVHDRRTEDTDPIFNLINAEGAFQYAKTLKWDNAKRKE